MTSRADPGSKRRHQFLEHFITVKVESQNSTPIGRNTVIGNTDSFIATTDTASGALASARYVPSRGSPTVKELEIEEKSEPGCQSARLQTASHLIGLPRRDPLKQKIIPAMHGIFGGDTARKTLIKVNQTLNTLA